MTYKILPSVESPSEDFPNVHDALTYLEENAEVGEEYEIVEVTKTVKYEMKKVLVNLNERDTMSTFSPVNSEEEEEASLPFA